MRTSPRLALARPSRGGLPVAAVVACLACSACGSTPSGSGGGTAGGVPPGSTVWLDQLGTPGNDAGYGVAVAANGDVLVAGAVAGAGSPVTGAPEAPFVARFDPSGQKLWETTFGTGAGDEARFVAPDPDGDVTVAGDTYGDLGGPNAGEQDVFVARFDGSGHERWAAQLGRPSADACTGLAVDASGDAYVVGTSAPEAPGEADGAFIARYGPDGTQLWVRRLATGSPDGFTGVAVDAEGDAVVVGDTGVSLGGAQAGLGDVLLAEYSPAGARTWIRQFGTPYPDQGAAVAVAPSGNIVVAGLTAGNLSAGDFSAGDFSGTGALQSQMYLAEFLPDSTPSWVEQFGTGADRLTGVAVDGEGNVAVSGFAEDDYGGPNVGGYDVLAARYAPTGTQLWLDHLGSPGDDLAYGVATGPAGEVLITGETSGLLGARRLGLFDAFVARLAP